jgi:hypothetical protein
MSYRDEITAARAALAALRAEIEAEFERRRASIQTRLEDACLGLFEETGKYAEVSRAYGSKDFRTVKGLVEAAQRRREQFEQFLPDDAPAMVAEYDPATNLYTINGTHFAWEPYQYSPIWKRMGEPTEAQKNTVHAVLQNADSEEYKALYQAFLTQNPNGIQPKNSGQNSDEVAL